ncbi:MULTISPECIES: general stress protein [Gracilibacillus]|uniref:general stress protein n=1 Tax=Gracilibacillus TaxID=74385 RepID=UPI00082620C6|nr:MULTISPECIES: general stress protein [Gracilibacillus]
MPFVKIYTNDETLEGDINTLVSNQIASEDIFVLSHDDDRTARIVKHSDASGVDYNKQDIGQAFEKQGDELREKLRELGIEEEDAQEYEADMDEGKVFLIVTNNQAADLLED